MNPRPVLVAISFIAAALLNANGSSARAQSAAPAAPPVAAVSDDPYLWLEEKDGARAMAWVKAENAKTLAVLQSDPRFTGFYDAALKISQAEDRIPYPEIINGQIYNFWRDANHVLGIWRTTSIADYANPQPAWTTVLDIDALAKAEGKKWVWQGADCDSPSRTRCLISLSEGGEDAATIREFDLKTRSFVMGGFSLPRGKQNVAWAADDALLVAREWQPGEVTASGYPFIVKRLERAQDLSAATEVFRGKKSDVSDDPFEMHDGEGHRLLGIGRGVSFFETETYVLGPAGPVKTDLPLKSNLQEIVAGRILVRLNEVWTTGGTTYPSGSLVSLDYSEAVKDPGHLAPSLVFAPGPRQSIGTVAGTKDRAVLMIYDNVRSRVFIYTPAADKGWTRKPLALPDNSTIGVSATNLYGSDAYLWVNGFLTPTFLLRLNADTLALSKVKELEPKFDASREVAEQFEATSSDGTRIPYFVVRPKNMGFDGKNPTILYAYGGFQISLTPSYMATTGKLWVERGGVFVIANIRGGGEFGPAWHEAGLKTHRQIVYDDFTAVARDLIARKITSPRRLGIEGGSNGGLLMGVEFTQHPELWNAVDIQVPLLDMLRYEQIQAGASWVGEYGSVSVPEERAFLASISPYNNIKPGVKYPEPLIWTTTKDDRVGPQHARKFAAKLGSMGIPYLFYEVTEGGHGSGADAKEASFTAALEFTYFTRKLMDP